MIGGRRRSARLGSPAAALALLLTAAVAPAVTLLPPDPDLVIGRQIAFDGLVDETGRPFQPTAEDRRPWVVSPIYTHCPSTCSAITSGLAAALRRAGLRAADYRVLSLSFDPRETDAGLAAFRARLRLPPEWASVRAADPAALQRILRSLDFRTLQLDNGHFEHPNLVTVLDAERRAVAIVYGVTPSATELATALSRARNGASALDRWRPYLFFFAAVGLLASAAVFFILLRRAQHRVQASARVGARPYACAGGRSPAPRSASRSCSRPTGWRRRSRSA